MGAHEDGRGEHPVRPPGPPGGEVVLRDGGTALVRPLLPTDGPQILAAFESLSPESRYRRFFTPTTRLSPSLLTYLTGVDHVDHLAWVALVDGVGAGVARCVRLQDDPAAADAAVTVVDAHHGRGLGTILLQVLAIEALGVGIERFVGEVLVENRPMLALLRAAGATIVRGDPGTYRFVIDLPERDRSLEGTALHAVLRGVARGEADLHAPGEGGPAGRS